MSNFDRKFEFGDELTSFDLRYDMVSYGASNPRYFVDNNELGRSLDFPSAGLCVLVINGTKGNLVYKPRDFPTYGMTYPDRANNVHTFIRFNPFFLGSCSKVSF